MLSLWSKKPGYRTAHLEARASTGREEGGENKRVAGECMWHQGPVDSDRSLMMRRVRTCLNDGESTLRHGGPSSR